MPSTTLTLQKRDVLNLPKATPTKTAAGPDGICVRALKHYAEQLNGVFQQLYQSLLDQRVDKLPWNTSTIIPVAHTNKACYLNDHRPIALTSLVIKELGADQVPHRVWYWSHHRPSPVWIP